MVKNKVSKVCFDALKVALLCGASLQFVQPVMAMEKNKDYEQENSYASYKVEEKKPTEKEIEEHIQVIKESDLSEKDKQITISELEWKKKNLNPVKCVGVDTGKVTDEFGSEFAKMIEKTEGIHPKEKINLINILKDNYAQDSKPFLSQPQKNIAEEIDELENALNLNKTQQKHLARLKQVQYLFETITHYTDEEELINLTGIED